MDYACVVETKMSYTNTFSKLGPRYHEPREVQTAILDALTKPLLERYNFLEAPVGIGKSAVAVSLGELINAVVTVITTGTMSLQNQYATDFPRIVSVVGRGNFPCFASPGLTAAEGPCNIIEMSCNSPYYEQERRAASASVIVTNYALYLADLLFGSRWTERKPTLLVCDEAHRLLDILTAVETASLDRRLAQHLGFIIPPVMSVSTAGDWATRHLGEIVSRGGMMIRTGQASAGAWLRLQRQAESLAMVDPSAIITKDSADKWEAAPLWPRYSAEMLRRSARFLLFMSATLSTGFLTDLLGIKNYNLYNAPSPFDTVRWPVYYKPVVSLNVRSSKEDWLKVGRAVHALMHSRQEETGIVHVAARKQVQLLLPPVAACPQCRNRIIFQRPKELRAAVITRFRQSHNGWIFHPSIGEGESFDDEQCRVQVIAKIRFPDLGNEVVRQRAADKGMGAKYYYESTVAYTAQTVGRGMRHEGDYCETFIFDGAFGNLYDRHKLSFPSWFQKQLR